MFMLKSTHRQFVNSIAAVFEREEFSGAKTLLGKASLAIARLDEHRQMQFRNRQKALTVGAALSEALKERDAARLALTDIAEMETPSCAHIGKRMAARARRELPAKSGSAPVRAAMEAM